MGVSFKINEREKKFLIYGGIVALLIVGFNVFSWYVNLKKEVNEIADTKLYMLEKQLQRIAGKENLIKKVESVRAEIERKEKAFLKGDTPPVAAADLQKFLKEKAASLNIEVKLERALNPVDFEYYLGIPVEIGFTASTNKLKNLLLEFRRSSILLSVAEIKLRVTNISNPRDIYTSLVVTGFIKKPGPADNGPEAEGKLNDT